MANTKSTAKKKTGAKRPAAKRSTAKAARLSVSSENYSQLTWALMIGWLVLVAVFLGLVVIKVYSN